MKRSNDMKAGMLTDVRSVEGYEIPDVRVQSNSETVIRVAYVGLCGTDLEIYHGTSNYLRKGQTSYPRNFGHEWVGTVEVPPADAGDTYLHRGSVVTGSTMIPCLTCNACRSGHRNLCSHVKEVGLYDYAGAAAERIVMPAHMLTVVDESVDAIPRPEHVLVEPLVTVLEGIAAKRPRPSDKILIMGGGTIGSLAALALRQYPVDVEVVDPLLPSYLVDLGISTVSSLSSDNFDAYDMVWECSGSVSATESIQSTLKTGGTAVLVGVPPADTKINVSELALKGQGLIGIRHGVDHYPVAVKFIRKHQMELQALIDQVYVLDDVSVAFLRLEKKRNRPKVVIQIV